MNRSKIIDNKYFFPVQKSVQSEMLKRKTRSNPFTSPIGFGAVPATITKKPAQGIVSLWDTCLEQLKPVSEDNKQTDETEKNAWIHAFLNETPPPPTDENDNNKRKYDVIESCDNREKLLKQITKKMQKKVESPPEHKPEIPEMVAKYHTECRENMKRGSVGLLPEPWQSEKRFPSTIEDLAESADGTLLVHFYKRMVK